MPNDERKRLRSRFTVQPGRPLLIDQGDAVRDGDGPESELSANVGKTLKAYRDAAVNLVANKYAALRQIAPPHMRGECDCLALMCEDGVLIRWDPKAGEKPKVRVGRVDDEANTVALVVPRLSEGLIHVAEDPSNFAPTTEALRLQFVKISPDGQSTPLAEHQLAIVLPAQALRDHGSARKPVPALSVLNEFTVQMLGEEVDADAGPSERGQRFLAVGRMKLAVGWQLIEVYPPLDAAVWDANAAAYRAELDLLAMAAQRNVADQTLRNLDRGSAMRREFSALLKQFEGLLGGREGPVQDFLEEHPELLRPSYARVWKRLALGDHVTDFVIREPAGEYVLVEIEAPIRPLFRKDGQPREELVHAINQVSDWIEHVQRNLASVERDLGLVGISSPRGLIVIGRSVDLTDDNRSKLNTLRGMIPRLDILTYDELLSATRTTLQNLLGTLPDPRTTADIYYLPRE